MSAIIMSFILGSLMVVVLPTLYVRETVKADRKASRPRRLDSWIVSTLATTTALLVWTTMWFWPVGKTAGQDANVLFGFCALGVFLAFGLMGFRRAIRR